MTELLTAAQMRAAEHAAIASGDVTGLDLMERAGRGVVAAIFAQWPTLAPDAGLAGGQPPDPRDISAQKKERHRAVVLCGPGNNGGDGFVVARLLKQAGWDVAVFLFGDVAGLPPDAQANYARWDGGIVSGLPAPHAGDGVDLYIDALFGTGLSRPVSGDLAQWIAGPLADPSCVARTVAVDLPSGLCSDSGRILGVAVSAALTVTFHRMKPGHVLDAGPAHCGRTVVADIGLVAAGDCDVVQPIIAPTCDLGRPERGHKYTQGHVLILSGGVGKGGAARLAARGALRVGAGAVTLGCPPAALIENAAQLNAVMVRPIRDADGLAAALADRRINALCLGPGLGTGDREAALVAAALGAEDPRPAVLDADALTLLAGDAALFAKLHDKCVLTPHAGEFARLFPDLARKLDAPAPQGPAYSKVDAARAAAQRAGCVVLFKGPDTVIAAPDGRCRINASVYDRSAPWLATAGSGDVLAGFITGLLARGITPMQAAETGAWLHTESARAFGPGLIAEDLPEQLPKVFRTLGL